MRKKKFLTVSIVILGCLVMFAASSYAVSLNDLEEKEFMVFMYCDDDAGDYCDKGGIKTEDFTFEDDSEFVIGTFEDNSYFYLDLASGTYKDQEILFEAEFEAIEELAKKYEFDIMGLNFFDTMILGVCEITYSRYKIPEFDYVKEDEASCYFAGFPK